MSIKALTSIQGLEGLNAYERSILSVLAHHADKNNVTKIYNRELMKQAGCSGSHSQKVIRSLKRQKIISYTPVVGRGAINAYHLNFVNE